MSQVQQAIAVAVGACTLLGIFVGYAKWWLPRWRRLRQRFDGAVDVLFGRPEIVDPASGQAVSPRLPSLGERLVGFERDLEGFQATLAPVAEVADDVAQVKIQVSEAPESGPGVTLREDVRIMSRFMEAHIEWSQEWTSRIEESVDRNTTDIATLGETVADHAARIAALEAHRCDPGDDPANS